MKKLFGSKKIAIIIGAMALVAGAMAGLFVLPMSPLTGSPLVALGAGARPSPDATQTQEHLKASKEATSEPGLMYPMKERIVNLADTGAFHYLKSEVVLEFQVTDAKNLKGEALKKRQEEFVKEMANRRPKLDDILTNVLSSKTSAVISTSDGREKLREELRTRMAEAVGEQKLVNLYFTQFIMQ